MSDLFLQLMRLVADDAISLTGIEAACFTVAYAAIHAAITLYEIIVVLRKRPLEERLCPPIFFYFAVFVSALTLHRANGPLPPAFRVVTISSWCVGAACDIMRSIVLRYHEWRARKEKQIVMLLHFLDGCRDQSARYAARFRRVFVASLLLMPLAVWCEGWRGLIVVLLMAAYLSALLAIIFQRPDSCRRLALCWMIGGMGFFMLFTDGVNILAGETQISSSFSDLAVISIYYSIFWCYSIGIADDGAGKLAAQAVNTITTLLTVVIGLLAANGADKYPGIPWERIQTKLITALLPLVVCGYIAALLKEAQIYWRKKYGGKEPE